MKIAYLILCHDDVKHVARLARRLVLGTSENSVYIHVDKKSSINDELIAALSDAPHVYVVDERHGIYWGGFSSINATYALLRFAVKSGVHDRYVLLQGADYPIKSNKYIDSFYEGAAGVEFMRAVNCATSEKKYFYAKARYSQRFDRRGLFRSIYNKIVRIFDIKSKPKHFMVDGQSWSVYWGCAHFAVTHDCVEMFLKYECNRTLRRHFRDIFPADETFFHTIVHNTSLSSRTSRQGPEKDLGINRLVDLINLTYFEYPSKVTVFTLADYTRIIDLPHLYVRKVRSAESEALVDLLDKQTGAADFPSDQSCAKCELVDSL